MLEQYREQELVDRALAELKFGEELECDKQVERPADGVVVHGLFMEGMRWSDAGAQLEDSRPGEMLAALPIMHMLPRVDLEPDAHLYTAPLYKTSARAGVLSTTGTLLQSLLSTHFYMYPYTLHSSLFTTHYSLLTTHYSLLTTHYSLLTTHY